MYYLIIVVTCSSEMYLSAITPCHELWFTSRVQNYIANYPTNRPIFAELHNELACNPATLLRTVAHSFAIVPEVNTGSWTINPARVYPGISSNFTNFDKELRLRIRSDSILLYNFRVYRATKALFRRQIVLIACESGSAWKLMNFITLFLSLSLWKYIFFV